MTISTKDLTTTLASILGLIRHSVCTKASIMTLKYNANQHKGLNYDARQHTGLNTTFSMYKSQHNDTQHDVLDCEIQHEQQLKNDT